MNDPNTIEVKGDYRQKLEVFGHVVSKHSGTFDVAKAVTGQSISQQVGPLTVTESVSGGVASVSVSAFGFSQQFKVASLVDKPLPFRFELDSGNVVEGTVQAVG